MLSSVGLLVTLSHCKNAKPVAYHQLIGKTMGTYYKVTYSDTEKAISQLYLDSLLEGINDELSTYINESYINQVNRAPSGTEFKNLPDHFRINLERSFYWYHQSEGYFDVSLQPLVDYWGFGKSRQAVVEVDSLLVTDFLTRVGMDQWKLADDKLYKRLDDQQIVLDAIAKGYGVDVVGEWLETLGVKNYLVDIGGEARARGIINTPTPESHLDDRILVIGLKDKSLASSGNYRNFHEVDGLKYGHTLNPKTGFPFQDSLLAVSIISDKCIDADAIATSCMAMGFVKAITFIDDMPEVSACFLVGTSEGQIDTRFFNGFIQYVIGR